MNQDATISAQILSQTNEYLSKKAFGSKRNYTSKKIAKAL
jgi:hypothetical protein